MGAKDWDYKNPLRGVRRAMDECRGAVVVAYPRYKIDAGTELRHDGGRSLEAVTFPTAWNQIEAAMAYEKGLPLLVVAESKLRREAMFDSGNDVRPFGQTSILRSVVQTGFLATCEAGRRTSNNALRRRLTARVLPSAISRHCRC